MTFLYFKIFTFNTFIAQVNLNLNKFYIFDKWMQVFILILNLKLLKSLNYIDFS